MKQMDGRRSAAAGPCRAPSPQPGAAPSPAASPLDLDRGTGESRAERFVPSSGASFF